MKLICLSWVESGIRIEGIGIDKVIFSPLFFLFDDLKK
ncbi:hypothetical protein FVB9288_01812 [Flavobacterium sp. CECT 9288]|nr:hypothetical protein FVB9288_01812 [Flavobacterium sp. CECT 9288]